ncbi:DUF397 domain-containing protein [Actinokineospora sp.]|uniref:DUF397 domain-containing protein n=1 Tax=Actinokineospora sp. TaxID=1872133 RepID=UPI0040382C7F
MRTYDPRAAATAFEADGWFKATASNDNGTGCVEVNFDHGQVGLRDSKLPHSPAFAFTPGEWRAFLDHTTR